MLDDMPDLAEVDTTTLDHLACQDLWCAVLFEMWKCAHGVAAQVRPHEVDAARSWLGSRDFHMTCSLAGVDPDAILSAWRSGKPWHGNRASTRHIGQPKKHYREARA